MLLPLRRPLAVLASCAAFAAVPAGCGDLAGERAASPALRPSPPAWFASGAVGLGPLTQSSQSPASVFRLSHPVTAPAVLSKGQWEVVSHVDWANYFCDGGERYLLDLESLRWRMGFTYGLDERNQLSVSGSASYQSGGILDGFIEGFERSVGAINHDRRRAPRDRYLVRLRGQDGSVQEFGGRNSGWQFESLSVGLARQVVAGTSTTRSLTASLVVKIPITRRTAGRPYNGLDIGLGLHAGKRLGRFHFYSSLGAVRFESVRTSGMELLRYQLSFINSVEYRASQSTSLITQVLVSGPVAYHFGELSDRTREMAFGLKHRIGDRLLLEISVVENTLVFSNSADVAFHTGLTWRL